MKEKHLNQTSFVPTVRNNSYNQYINQICADSKFIKEKKVYSNFTNSMTYKQILQPFHYQVYSIGQVQVMTTPSKNHHNWV